VSQEPERSRRVVDRPIDAQQGALDVTGRALDAGAEGLDEDERPGTSERLEAALVDGRDTLRSGA
jgi:hypothetical protein